jgi:predicted RNase H-like nuclease
MQHAGFDGCRAGWVRATEHAVDIVAHFGREQIDGCIVGIDMPIGLPSASPRACDGMARAALGARRSSVFSCPPRACLPCADYPDALASARAATGVGISKQAFHLLPKIAEVDRIVNDTDDAQVAETHPECAFMAMNGGQPMGWPKHTPEGIRARRRLLRGWFGPLPATPRGAADHDVLDALAVLWSTQRFAAGEHITYSDGARDERNLPMRIIC